MSDLCTITILGRLTKDAQTETTKNGSNVIRFSIARSRRERNRNGEYEDVSYFYNCQMYRKDPDGAAKLAGAMTKGTPVAVRGDIIYSDIPDRNGEKGNSRYWYIFVEDFSFQSGKPAQSSDNGGRRTGHSEYQGRNQQPQRRQAPSRNSRNDDYYEPENYGDDDIPEGL